MFLTPISIFMFWLTLDDMTVLDLTVHTKLLYKGYKGPKLKAEKPLIWDLSIPGDLDFVPVLVDNHFMYKVDIIQSYIYSYRSTLFMLPFGNR